MDRLVDLEDQIVTISKIQHDTTNGTKIFNLSVTDNHNYFVGNGNILTHNINCAQLDPRVSKVFGEAGDLDVAEYQKLLDDIASGKISKEEADMIKAQIADLNVAREGKYVDELKQLDEVIEGTSILDQSVIDDILATAKGSRPNPSTYLPEEYITNHLAKFDEGITKFAWGRPTYPDVGHPTGTFVMPKSVADDLLQKSGGDVKELERLLGLNPGDLGDAPVRIDIPEYTGLRMPTGNEFGANENWIPGGFTDGGAIPEAVIDQVPVEKVIFTDLFQ